MHLKKKYFPINENVKMKNARCLKIKNIAAAKIAKTKSLKYCQSQNHFSITNRHFVFYHIDK